MSDRKAANTALAKVLAYQQCGQEAKAKKWARVLLGELGYTPGMLAYDPD